MMLLPTGKQRSEPEILLRLKVGTAPEPGNLFFDLKETRICHDIVFFFNHTEDNLLKNLWLDIYNQHYRYI